MFDVFLTQVGQLGGESELLGFLYGSEPPDGPADYGLGSSGLEDYGHGSVGLIPSLPPELDYFQKQTFQASGSAFF